MTDRRVRIRVGIFAVAAAALAVLVVIVFGGLRLFRHSDHYVIESSDSVMGLEPGARVYVNGIDVGVVTDIQLAPDDLRHVRIDIDLDRGTPIHADTRAFVSLPGLMGMKVIDLRGGSYAAAVVPVGGTIPTGEGTLDKIQHQAEKLADQTGKLIERAGAIADDAQQVMHSIATLVDPKKIGAIEDDLAGAARGMRALVDENRVAVHDAVQSFATASKSASEMMTKGVDGLVTNAGEVVADLRGVVRGNQTSLQAALADLRQAARSFKELAREVRDKPSRLFFSDSQSERRLP